MNDNDNNDLYNILLTKTICPHCGTDDVCEFVFARHYNGDGSSFVNPSDDHVLYFCENTHVFTAHGETYLEVLPTANTSNG